MLDPSVFKAYDVRGIHPTEIDEDGAKGAALGTGTTMDFELVNSVYNVLPNDALADVMQGALERVGAHGTSGCCLRFDR